MSATMNTNTHTLTHSLTHTHTHLFTHSLSHTHTCCQWHSYARVREFYSPWLNGSFLSPPLGEGSSYHSGQQVPLILPPHLPLFLDDSEWSQKKSQARAGARAVHMWRKGGQVRRRCTDTGLAPCYPAPGTLPVVHRCSARVKVPGQQRPAVSTCVCSDLWNGTGTYCQDFSHVHRLTCMYQHLYIPAHACTSTCMCLHEIQHQTLIKHLILVANQPCFQMSSPSFGCLAVCLDSK